MRAQLVVLAAVLSGCEHNGSPRQPTARSPSLSPVDLPPYTPPSLVRFTSEPVALGGPSQHHAVVALRPDGLALVAWYGERLVDVASVDTETLVVTPIDAAGDIIYANHPAIEATSSGWLAVASAEAGGLVGRGIDADGLALGEPVVLSAATSLYPDLAASGAVGLSLSTDTERLSCTAFVGAFLAPTPIPCPSPIDRRLAIGAPSVQLQGEQLWYTWTERDPTDTSFHVVVATTLLGTLVTTPIASHAWGGEMAGRVQLAVGEGWRLLSWRGAYREGQPMRSFLLPLEADGRPIGKPWLLGSAPEEIATERPTLAGAGDHIVAAWEEEGQLWLQVRDPSGAPLGGPAPAGTDPGRVPRRPAVDLVQHEDGHVSGIVSWESAPIGSAVEIYDRFVMVRTFELL